MVTRLESRVTERAPNANELSISTSRNQSPRGPSRGAPAMQLCRFDSGARHRQDRSAASAVSVSEPSSGLGVVTANMNPWTHT